MKYFEIGNIDNIVVSNSSMSSINPEQGGSPMQFRDFISNRLERKDTSYNRLGTAIDKYVESPNTINDIIAEEINRPGDSWVGLVEEMIKLESKHEYIDNDFYMNNELLFEARNNINFQGNWKAETVLDKFKIEALPYYHFLKDNKDKLILTANEKHQLEMMKSSLLSNKQCNLFLFELDNLSNQHFKQAAIYFKVIRTIKVNNKETQVELKCKCLLDHLIINTKDNYFFVNDLKTTSRSLSLFNKSFEEYRYYRQLSFYIFAVQLWLMGKAMLVDNNGQKVDMQFKPDAPTCKIYSGIYAVETNNYFRANYIPIRYDSNWLKKGTQEYNSLLDRIAYHIYTNNWDDDMEVLSSGGQRFLKEPI